MKVELQEVGYDMKWTEQGNERGRWREVVNAVMNLRFP